MSMEPRQEDMTRRRSNYRQRRDQQRKVPQSNTTANSPIIPSNDSKNTHLPTRIKLTSMRHFAQSTNFQQFPTGKEIFTFTN